MEKIYPFSVITKRGLNKIINSTDLAAACDKATIKYKGWTEVKALSDVCWTDSECYYDEGEIL